MRSNFHDPRFNSVEMGVCRDTAGREEWNLVPIDNTVKQTLVSMLHATYDQLDGEKEQYELTQKYGTTERLILQTSDPVSAAALELYRASNISTNPHALDAPESVIYYFAVFRIVGGPRLLAVRRAAQFKAVLKARNRLVRMVDETLRTVDDTIFKLDLEFDYVVEPDQILILHPSGFEYTASIEGQVAEAAISNLRDLGSTMSFVDFESLAPFVQSHKRAARTVAALRSRSDLANISRRKLLAECKLNGVKVRQRAGKLAPVTGNEDWFLKILDRRLYTTSLIEDQSERYEAANRRRT